MFTLFDYLGFVLLLSKFLIFMFCVCVHVGQNVLACDFSDNGLVLKNFSNSAILILVNKSSCYKL